jgi:hypothetical protein
VQPRTFSQSGIQQRLIISDVIGNKNKTLFATDSCGYDNDQTLTSVEGDLLKTTQGVNFLKEISPDDVRKVKGWYELTLPTKVNSINVSINENNQHHWDGGAFRLSRVQGSKVQYRIIGDDRRLIDIRALNAKNQLLSLNSDTVDGDIRTLEFNGGVVGLELLVAQELQSKRFEFTLNTTQVKTSKQFKKSHVNRTIKAFTKSERSKFRKRANDKSFLTVQPIAKDELGRSQTKTAHLIFNLKKPRGVAEEMSGEIIIPFNELLLTGVDALSVNLEINQKHKTEFSPTFKFDNTAKSSFEVDGQRYLRGLFSIKLDKEIDEINSVSGKLNFELPSKINRKVANVGAETKSDLRLLGYEYGAIPLSRYASAKDFFTAVLVSKSGSVYLAEKSPPNILSFDYAGQAKKIELLSVSNYDRFSESFKVDIR